MKVYNIYILQPDSVTNSVTATDTIRVGTNIQKDIQKKETQAETSDSIIQKVVKTIPAEVTVKKEIPKEASTDKVPVDIFKEANRAILGTANTVKTKVVREAHSTKIFHYPWENAPIFNYSPGQLWKETKAATVSRSDFKFMPHVYLRSQLNWTLFIALLSTILLMSLKTYYRKFVDQVVNTLVNSQLADKLLREKNILVRRAFFMLNLNFLLIFSLFILLLMNYFDASFTKSQIKNYFFIVGIVAGVLLVRLILYYLVAFIFEWRAAITHQIHSSYLINKNIGLVLLPIVYAAIYTTPTISKILLFTGLGLFFIASFYKLIKGFQIILRNGILLFYAFLYLCTLELLPWIIGAKLIIYLR